MIGADGALEDAAWSEEVFLADEFVERAGTYAGGQWRGLAFALLPQVLEQGMVAPLRQHGHAPRHESSTRARLDRRADGGRTMLSNEPLLNPSQWGGGTTVPEVHVWRMGMSGMDKNGQGIVPNGVTA